VSLCVGHDCEPCKTDEFIEMPFGADRRGGLKEQCVRWGGVQIPHCKGKFLEESCADPLSTEKYREVRCGMMNEDLCGVGGDVVCRYHYRSNLSTV